MKTTNFDDYFVATLDILGGKNYILNDSNNTVFHTIHDAFKTALEIVQNKNSNFKSKNFITEYRIFSDNIVIYQKSKANKNEIDALQLNFFLGIIGEIQQLFLKNDLLVRGGVTVGEFFRDEIMVWGKALLETIIIESETAIYPRVVLSEKLVDKEDLLSALGDRIRLDCDGLYYIDFIYYYNLYDNTGVNKYTGIDKKDIELHIYNLNKLLVKNHNIFLKYKQRRKPKISSKYGWINSYLNYKLNFAKSLLQESFSEINTKGK